MSYGYIYAGRTIRLPAGTLVRREGKLTKRSQPTVVTVKRVEPARNGKVRVFWKSNGITAQALV